VATEKHLIYGSICSGIEAATVAWHPLGWTPAFFAEIEKFPSQVFLYGLLNLAAIVFAVVFYAIIVSFDRWRQTIWWGIARCIALALCLWICWHLIYLSLDLFNCTPKNT
jgi:hypothetical protein